MGAGAVDAGMRHCAATWARAHRRGVVTLLLTNAGLGNGVVTMGMAAHALWLDLPQTEVASLVLVAVLAGVYAGVLPEDKFRLAQALQAGGDVVGMSGDGANDASALRPAQMGIAVSTATEMAKAAAGIVLTEPGLAGIVGSIREGRITYQRVLTYTLRSIIHKVVQVLFLSAGLVMTGEARRSRE